MRYQPPHQVGGQVLIRDGTDYGNPALTGGLCRDGGPAAEVRMLIRGEDLCVRSDEPLGESGRRAPQRAVYRHR